MSETTPCPVCQKPYNPEETACTICGWELLGDPIVGGITHENQADYDQQLSNARLEWQKAEATGRGGLQPGGVKLIVEKGISIGKQFVLADTEIQIGREDEDEDIFPDIDLSDQDEGYVHRRHVTLRFENGGLTITHLGGANKTRVNNRRLSDNQPQALNIGDKVVLGKVVLYVQEHP